jgi:hypothetical protein
MTPVQAMLWQIGWRHRWWLAVDAAYLLAAAITIRLLPEAALRLTLGDLETPQIPYFLGSLCVFVMLHFIAVFSGVELSHSERQRGSDFPTHLLVLPVTTRFLVVWPMLSGCLAAGLLWLFVATQVFWPGGIAAPLIWPMLLFAATIAGMQAISWTPVSPAWLRSTVAVPVLMAIVGGTFVAGIYGFQASVCFLFLLPILGLAYAAALRGVGMTRRGDCYDWRSWQRLVDHVTSWRKPADHPFRSAARAQLWFECRGQGWLVPLIGGTVMFVMLFPLLGIEKQDVTIGWKVLLFLFAVPPFLGGMLGSALARRDAWSKAVIGPFLATRPLTSAALVKSKFQMCAISAVSTWLLAALAAAVLVLVRAGLAHSLFQAVTAIGLWRAAVIILVIAGGSLVFTWLQMVSSLWMGLTGREWVVNVFTFGFIGLLTIGGMSGFWVFLHPEWQPWAVAASPWIEGILVTVKLAIAALVVAALLRQQQMNVHQVAMSLGLWCLIVAALLATGRWLLPAALISWSSLLAALVLFVPFSRLAIAPLALDWNRHR